jgi:prevent-host-death family protein
MHEIGAFEAKNRLGSLLDQVERGQEIIITRRGKAVARLVPVAGAFNRAQARQAATNLVARSKGVTLNGLKVKELINEGRP